MAFDISKLKNLNLESGEWLHIVLNKDERPLLVQAGTNELYRTTTIILDEKENTLMAYSPLHGTILTIPIDTIVTVFRESIQPYFYYMSYMPEKGVVLVMRKFISDLKYGHTYNFILVDSSILEFQYMETTLFTDRLFYIMGKEKGKDAKLPVHRVVGIAQF